MATTVQVSRETLEALRKLKEERSARSYDAAIRELILEGKRLRSSQMGKYPRLKPFVREELDRLGDSSG